MIGAGRHHLRQILWYPSTRTLAAMGGRPRSSGIHAVRCWSGLELRTTSTAVAGRHSNLQPRHRARRLEQPLGGLQQFHGGPSLPAAGATAHAAATRQPGGGVTEAPGSPPPMHHSPPALQQRGAPHPQPALQQGRPSPLGGEFMEQARLLRPSVPLGPLRSFALLP